MAAACGKALGFHGSDRLQFQLLQLLRQLKTKHAKAAPRHTTHTDSRGRQARHARQTLYPYPDKTRATVLVTIYPVRKFSQSRVLGALFPKGVGTDWAGMFHAFDDILMYCGCRGLLLMSRVSIMLPVCPNNCLKATNKRKWKLDGVHSCERMELLPHMIEDERSTK